MAKFIVTLHKTVIEALEVEIDAETREAAEAQADAAIETGEYDDHDWETVEDSQQITDVELDEE